MSFDTTSFRPFARGGFGGRGAGHFRGLLQTDKNDLTGRTVINRGQVGTVVYRSTGVTQNKFLSGVTRDSAGSILGNCIVDLFQTGGDIITQTTVSDENGSFTFANPGTGPFYIVSYKVGSPDVAGTTVNTLAAV